MKAWLTARRVKSGHEDEFRKKWRGGETPQGMVDAFLLEDEQDPRETLSVSLWDTAESLLAYRTGDDARKREDHLSDVVDKTRWRRSFVAWNAWDLEAEGGKRRWLLMLPLLVAAGAGAYAYFKQRARRNEEQWDNWEPEPAGTYQPTQAPRTGAAANTSPAMPPPPVRPLDGEQRNGGSRPAQQPPGGPVHSGSMQTASSMAAAATGPTSTGTATTGQRRHRGRTVRDFMTRDPETVDVNTDAATAAAMMRDLNVGVLPVMAGGRLAGIITDRDLALNVAAREAKPSTVRAGDLMTDTPRTIAPDAGVDEAARMMAEHQIRRLPVVEGTRLVGIIALGDLAAEGAEQPAAGALHEISEPARPQT